MGSRIISTTKCNIYCIMFLTEKSIELISLKFHKGNWGGNWENKAPSLPPSPFFLDNSIEKCEFPFNLLNTILKTSINNK